MGYKGIVVEAFGLGGINVLNKGLRAIGQGMDQQEISGLFTRNLAGEVTA